MDQRRKATGWKVPLLFCSAVIIGAACVRAFAPGPASAPSLPEPLIERAKKITINLDNPAGARWQKAILAAAQGFAPSGEKDSRLEEIIREALAEKRLDAACAAILHLHDKNKKDALLGEIFEAALSDCARLPWSVFAARAAGANQRAADMAASITKRWRRCAGREAE